MITAFEVFEHFANPREELNFFFQLPFEYLFFSTKLYRGQGPDWWYFLEDGQHVQFYSEKSLRMIAVDHGYHFQTDGCTFHLLSKKPFPFKGLKKIAKLALIVEKKIARQWPSRTAADFKNWVYPLSKI
jgi:hypothetical protein